MVICTSKSEATVQSLRHPVLHSLVLDGDCLIVHFLKTSVQLTQPQNKSSGSLEIAWVAVADGADGGLQGVQYPALAVQCCLS